MEVGPAIDVLHKETPFAFVGEEAKALAMQAITHASLSSTHNNTEMARVGDALAVALCLKELFLSPEKKSGAEYNRVRQLFSQASLASIGRTVGVDRVIRMGNGTTSVSDSMVADALRALFAAVEISKGPDELVNVLKVLGIK